MDDTTILPPNSKAIPLTKDKYAIVDEADYDWLMQSKWFFSERGYALKRRENRKSGEGMHRILTNPPKGMMADHINGDRLDNRRSNLRLVTALQNAQNRGKNKNSLSMYKGVSWKVSNNKWQARIRINGQQHHIGLYGTELEAAQAYNQAARIQHGQYARLNNILGAEVFCGEISDNEENAWQVVNTVLAKRNYIGKERQGLADEIWEAIRPYLRTTVPVMSEVSLSRCLNAYLNARSAGHTDKDVVVIVLKVAGVKYAD